MANLKFFKAATTPGAAEIGAIWFDSTSKLLKVKNETGWEVYDGGRNVVDAAFAENKLTITKADTSKIELDFSDVASAKTTMAVFEKLNTAISNADTKAQKGVDDAATAQAAAEAAQTTADAKIASVTGDTTVNAKTDTGHNVTLSLVTNNDGNVKFTQNAKGLSANVTIPEATVTGVGENDKVLSLNNKLVSATVGLTYGDSATLKDSGGNAKKSIQLLGKNNVVIAEIDASDFIKDGMVNNVVFNEETKHVTITFNTDAGHEAIDVDLSTLVDTYKAGTGLSLAADGTFSVDTDAIATVAKAGELATAAETAAKTYADGLKETIDGYTINDKGLSSDQPIVLSGADIKVGGTGNNRESTINTVVEDLYTKVSEAKEAGVTSFGGVTGDVTLASSKTTNGSVNLTITDKKLSASIVGLKSAAYTESSAYATSAQGDKADTALQSVTAEGDTYVSASVGTKASNSQKISITATIQEVSSATTSKKGLAEASDVKNYVDNHVASTLAWTTFE